jgi:hypothetical protein
MKRRRRLVVLEVEYEARRPLADGVVEQVVQDAAAMLRDGATQDAVGGEFRVQIKRWRVDR